MKRTIKEWFSLVKDHSLRIELLQNLNPDYIDFKEYVNSIYEAINDGFDWYGTKRGWSYWDKIIESNIELIDDPQKDFKTITDGIADLLKYKNKKYGNSALNPLNIFNGKSKVGQRADDKLSRIQNSDKLAKNDIVDLIGYLVLICEENDWRTFDEFKD